jgi:dienelactone hydrolase
MSNGPFSRTQRLGRFAAGQVRRAGIMQRTSYVCFGACLFVLASVGIPTRIVAQHPPDATQLAALQQTSTELSAKISSLRQPPQTETLQQQQSWADAAVYAKAAEWMLRHNEFFKPDYKNQLEQVLTTGRVLVDRLQESGAEPESRSGTRIHGYVSRIDGSVQPYALSLPADWTPDSRERRPLHLVLHGRANQMNEVNFITRFHQKPVPESQTWVQLDVYGRGNNAYRWAGETDVFEALDDVQRRYRIDEDRITLRGFSMGGAGAWHLGMHHPHRWCSVGPGAGFVDFYKYQNRDAQLPAWQHATLGIYDTVDYAMNAANVPVCTYGGENDPQLAASTTMAAEADALGIDLKVIVGPGMGHKFDAESRREFMKFHEKYSAAGRPAYLARKSIRFTTKTLKYNSCDWLTIEELGQPYVPATIEANVTDDGDVEIFTENVTAFRIYRDVGRDVVVDGVRLPCRIAADGLLPDVYYRQTGDGWELLNYEDSRAFTANADLNKRHGLQGPIDDAFMERFVCVVGTGKPWNAATHEWSLRELERFRRDWDLWMRGSVPVIKDTELTDQMVKDCHVVLFGDPGSNSVLAKFLPELPVEWTAETLTVGPQTWVADSHVLNMVYPNPWHPRRYVVVNSGFTVRDADFRASNSWLFPKLGDIAVRKIRNRDVETAIDDWSDVVWASIFNSHWKLATP